MGGTEWEQHVGTEAALRRIGLDIHDGPLQELAVLSSRLYGLRESLARTASDAELVRSASAIIDGVGDIAEQLRACVGAARGRLHAERTFLEEVGRMVELYADSFTLDLDLDLDACPLSEVHGGALARILQTVLANVAQHSGAQYAHVVLSGEDGPIVLEVIDDGCGFDVESTLRRAAEEGRLGLTSVMERVQALGGEAVIRSAPGGPTLIRVVLPNP